MVLSVELPFAGMENGFTNREGNVIGSFGLKKFLVESVTSNLLLHDVAANPNTACFPRNRFHC